MLYGRMVGRDALIAPPIRVAMVGRDALIAPPAQQSQLKTDIVRELIGSVKPHMRADLLVVPYLIFEGLLYGQQLQPLPQFRVFYPPCPMNPK